MPKTTTIAGNTFLFTGKLTEFIREDAEAHVEAEGGKVLSGVSAKLNYLVVGEDAGSKLKKAEALGTVTILHEKEFLKMMNSGKKSPDKSAPKKNDNHSVITKKTKNKVNFETLNEKEFYKRFPLNNFSDSTRMVIYFDMPTDEGELSIDDAKNNLINFLNEKPYLSLEKIFVYKDKDDFDDECYKVYGFCYANSSLAEMDTELVETSSLISGISIKVLDFDNNLWQTYYDGDYDSGMKNTDWDADDEENESYRELIAELVKKTLPMKLS